MQLARIVLHPIKSLDAIEVAEAEFTAMGALRHDREWALYDAKGAVINGKATPALHPIRARYAPDLSGVTLAAPGHRTASLPLDDLEALGSWFGGVLQLDVTVLRDPLAGFPDDLEANGPTLVSEASLSEVAGWFGLDVGQIRRRFRSNLEIAGAPPFFEDRLCSEDRSPVEFRLGTATLHGCTPCQRCVVPSRAADTGVVTPGFAAEFARRRISGLPSWAPKARFDHGYRFSVNTRLGPGQAGTRIRVGDPLVLPSLHP
jgi:hypothetical protein